MRVLIIGGPRSGKSVLASRMGLKHYCTDPISLVKEPMKNVTYLPEGLEWGKDSEYVVKNWFTQDNCVIEGVGVARALRKFTGDKPCDRIIILKDKHPFTDRTDGQEVMAKAVLTIWGEVADKYRSITQYL